MHVVKVSLGDRDYDIEIGTSLDQIGDRLQGLGFGQKIAFITNPRVKKLYGQRVADSLKAAGFLVLPSRSPTGAV
jgi:3-dehydroquinate synthetase